MVGHIGGWEKLEELREGGQGRVWLVRSAEAARRRESETKKLGELFRAASTKTTRMNELEDAVARLAKAISDFNRNDRPEDLAAAKVFVEGVRDDAQSLARLRKEAEVLQVIDHPAVVRFRDFNESERFLVTEYHKNGALREDPKRFEGDVLGSLRALRPLIDALAKIHAMGAIHRDIKPANILVGDDGRLILADFGIVFFQDDQKTRITNEAGERVGSEKWMAPWANKKSRIQFDQLSQTFDLFPIGKLLYWMLSGGEVLDFWHWDDEENDLRRVSKDPALDIASRLFAVTLVHKEKDCCQSATELLAHFDKAISDLELNAARLHVSGGWPCPVCKVGVYKAMEKERTLTLALPQIATVRENMSDFYPDLYRKHSVPMRPFRCSQCGHLALFAWPTDKPAPDGWRLRESAEPQG